MHQLRGLLLAATHQVVLGVGGKVVRPSRDLHVEAPLLLLRVDLDHANRLDLDLPEDLRARLVEEVANAILKNLEPPAERSTRKRENATEKHKATLFFVSRLLGPRVCGRQEKKTKKNTLSPRGCSFWVPLNTREGLTRTPHGKKHTLNTRGCSFEYH